MKTLEDYKEEQRNHPRYPYTCACDWLRMKGLADSRSDASKLFDGYDEAVKLAEKYVTYWAMLEMADHYLHEAV